MSTCFKGSCSCVAITVQVDGEPSMVALCHCLNCQKTTGSTYSMNWVLPRCAFKVLSSAPVTYEALGDSGSPALRRFCGTCSSTMWTESSRFPDMVVLKAGILDEGGLARFTPSAETFTSRKPKWVNEVAGAVQCLEAFSS
ncbi:uncharacterized protein PV09_03318 [Verruconis gallopava]|uniref:CENP-V/GFA domain-containing protein n=1 Tax=Verruconis gallopava TaxID=253628 RepID=A0A0D1XTR2_9PEZI|nr:uncharacterized protein PV09_03318 [Verruconis gallopava]KIW06156.1 hypothetical protein PV09_03318 [Verruconis gallopava]